MMASMLAGLAMAIALFFLMSGLISAESAASRRPNTTLNLDFIRLNLDEMEKATIERALRKHGFNISRAAAELGLTRASLYRRMEKHGI